MKKRMKQPLCKPGGSLTTATHPALTHSNSDTLRKYVYTCCPSQQDISPLQQASTPQASATSPEKLSSNDTIASPDAQHLSRDAEDDAPATATEAAAVATWATAHKHNGGLFYLLRSLLAHVSSIAATAAPSVPQLAQPKALAAALVQAFTLLHSNRAFPKCIIQHKGDPLQQWRQSALLQQQQQQQGTAATSPLLLQLLPDQCKASDGGVETPPHLQVLLLVAEAAVGAAAVASPAQRKQLHEVAEVAVQELRMCQHLAKLQQAAKVLFGDHGDEGATSDGASDGQPSEVATATATAAQGGQALVRYWWIRANLASASSDDNADAKAAECLAWTHCLVQR